MLYEFRLHDLGEGLVNAEIMKWHVKEGENVGVDDILLEVQTDKAAVEITSPVSGKISSIFYKSGEIVSVGDLLLSIETDGSRNKTKTAAPQISPYLRKMAKDFGIDISLVKGTGPNHRITESDILRYKERMEAVDHDSKNPPTNSDRASLVRSAIAKKLSLAKSVIPDVTTVDEICMDPLLHLVDSIKNITQSKLSVFPFITKLVSLALKKHPILNAVSHENKVMIKEEHNIGIAVNTPYGVYAPVIKNVEKKSVLQLAEEMKQLTKLAKENKLQPHDMQDGTITITNMGPIGGLFATPIINYPQVAIIGINKMQKRPVVIEDELQIRQMIYLSVTFDHRFMDGVEVVTFINLLKKYMENPEVSLLGIE
ncbi:dihydrolipoamide acetyltransferase family protein [Thermoflavimicrobium dichotomicum]|uniref:Dihydrolipoamide acetyltransferase component of pyruvate dehydrogenase complex n=1 Tax=Thermoflavimicrobium dichotomicum TaxID=46223 RepID=A0A1I3TKF1_9BACL|nr:dihydrolipoamide acetyltransferase family protein [Thermoflavimicrobium dichotomicum]SFJ69997.1 pyruvate dehydrogenase E2 component (dihydrolipoamide acetyltransferase) [Thermoflavimicrobium dichotomicum]